MTRISHANRGQDLEDMIEATNQQYLHQGRALVQKIPEPVNQISKIDKQGHFKAHYAKKSTVDYIGVYQGRSIAFDAKQTSIETRFDLSNVKEHQYLFLSSWVASGGIGFLVVYFSSLDEFYYLPYELLDKYWQGQFQGGRKSIPYEKIAKEEYQIQSNQVPVDYLEVVERVIDNV